MMKRLDYLVKYHNNNSIYCDSSKNIPISVILRKEADAEEKLKSIMFELIKKTGDKNINLLGIFKL